MKENLKRINKWMCFALACCVLVTVFFPLGMVTTHAASVSDVVAKVGDTEYKDYREAWKAVKDGGTVTMLADWHTDGLLTVEKGKSVTVNMNGHMINRGLKKRDDSGEIFLVQNDALLILNGNGVNTTEHWGTVRESKWTYQGEGKGNIVINGSLLTGGFNDDGGGAIHIQESAEVKIDGITIAGNVDNDKGGAIRLQGNYSKLTVTNSAIAYNRADYSGGGAAIRAQGTDCYVKIVDTKIHHNLVRKDSCDGGAIYVNNGTVEIENSVISFNEAGRNGGAIYVYNGNLSIDKNTVISYNVANKEGGAIYVNSKADKVKIEGYYVGNNAAEEGGAIYVNSSVSGVNGVHISNVEMIGNIANENGGGAVYVDSDNNITLSGQVIMHGNSPDNLHIRSGSAIAENNMTDGSKVGIFTSWDVTESASFKTKNPQYFFSDKIGYAVKAADGAFYYVKDNSLPLSTYKVGDIEYALLKSAFCYTAMAGGTMNPDFYYSDGYFAEDPKYYNEHLATLAASMALAAMTAVYEGEYTEDKAAKNILDMFVTMGYSDIFVHYPEPEYFGPNAENLSTIGYVIAKRTAVIDGKETTIIATAVRGAGYGAEWASNVTLGSGVGEAQGFGDAAKQVKQGIDAYITKYGIDADSAKFFITGYSRAGATSNLVAKKLTDTYGEDQVYAYCIEAPKGGVFSELKEGFTYTNIHNIINGVDIITYVGTKQMGFIRYGVDHMMPDGKVGSELYNEQKKLMMAQLAIVNRYIEQNDKFAEATLEYSGSKLPFGIFDMIDPEWFPDYDTAEDWIPVFIEKLQEYSMTDMRDKADPDHTDGIFNNKSDDWYGYRNFYSNYKWYVYFDETDGNKMKIKAYVDEPEDFASGKYKVHTLEDAIGNLMLFYFGMPEDRKAELTAVIGELDTDKIMDSLDMTHIWWSVIDDWREFSIDKKNVEFHKIWSVVNKCMKPEEGQKTPTTTLEAELKKVLTEEEYETLLSSLYVLIDFGLDFVAEDYNITDQNLLGTLLYNIGNILQTHYHDIAYSWIRSYDSFFNSAKYVCVHNYSEWNVLKEATEDDYGVHVKTCSRCGKEIYEAMPKLVNETEQVPVAASLFGEGSVIAIVLGSAALIVEAVAIYFYVKYTKNSSASEKEEA